MDRLTWCTQLAEAIRCQLGAGASPADDLQITQSAAAMAAWLDGAVGDDCASVLDGDPRLLTAGALQAQLVYDPAGLSQVQAAVTAALVEDLTAQLRCEFRRRAVSS